jgi:hypothetical protein
MANTDQHEAEHVSEPRADGDFRSRETTIASLRSDDLFEVRLRADRPPPPWRTERRFLACLPSTTASPPSCAPVH